MKFSKILFGGVSLILASLPFKIGHAQVTFNGGGDLVYVQPAYTLPAGRWTIMPHSRVYFARQNNINFFDITGLLSANYAPKDRVEFFTNVIYYQDINQASPVTNTPDKLFLGFKLGSISPKGSPFIFGLQVAGRIPLSNNQNIPFQPYSFKRVALGANALFTYAVNRFFPQDAAAFNLNFGYWNHNDKGVIGSFEQGLPVFLNSPSQELVYGAGFTFRRRVADFSLEVTGNKFISSPPTFAHSRESYLYLSPAVHVKLGSRFVLTGGVDVKLTEQADGTDYTLTPSTFLSGQDNYSDFRINIGVKVSNFQVTKNRLMKEAYTLRDPRYYLLRFNSLYEKLREKEGVPAGQNGESDRRRQFMLWQFRLEGNPHYYIIHEGSKSYMHVSWLREDTTAACERLTWKLSYKGTQIGTGETELDDSEIATFQVPLQKSYRPGVYDLSAVCVHDDGENEKFTASFHLKELSQRTIGKR